MHCDLSQKRAIRTPIIPHRRKTIPIPHFPTPIHIPPFRPPPATIP